MPPQSPPVTASLIDRLRAGDPDALNALIAHTYDRLRVLARRMLRGFPDVARWMETGDVLHNAFCRLDRALRAEPPGAALHFYRLAALQLRRELLDLADHWRGPHGPGANHHTDPTGEIAAGQSAPPDVRQSVSVWAEIHGRVEQLPKQEREVVGLIWYEGLTQEEAAEVLGVCRKTVGRRWQSARLTLERALGGPPNS